MDVQKQFESLSQEFSALRDLVVNWVGSRPGTNQDSGRWRESVVRSVIRRSLPASLQMGNGFLINEEKKSSNQQDIIIYSGDGPLYFKDGDFVIVPTSCVRAVIEIKSKIKKVHAESLAQTCSVIGPKKNPFIGMFGYDASDGESVPKILRGNNPSEACPITAIADGPDRFWRFWQQSGTNEPGSSWKEYETTKMAQGYLLSNLICSLGPSWESHWFPDYNKKAPETTICRDKP